MIWKIATLLLLISIGAKADDDYYDSDDGQFLPTQLWKYNPSSSKLENIGENWKYEAQRWNLPSEGSTGQIQAASGKVLGVNGNNVELQNSDDSDQQSWTRTNSNSQGYFTLQNPLTGKLLTAESTFDEDLLKVTDTSETGAHGLFEFRGATSYCSGELELIPTINGRRFVKSSDKRSHRFVIKKKQKRIQKWTSF